MYKIIDDFLNEKEYSIIENTINNNNFSWYYEPVITTGEDESAFFHLLINKGKSNSHYTGDIMSIFEEKLNIEKTFRAKVNLYTRTDNLKIHNYHYDNIGYKIAIFYVNENNGYTELKDITKIESKKNRLLLFEGDIEHRSTNCTDEKTRINININYSEDK